MKHTFVALVLLLFPLAAFAANVARLPPPETWPERRVTGCVERAFVVSRRGYDPEWNLARVIRRGTSTQGHVSVIQDCPGLRFIVR